MAVLIGVTAVSLASQALAQTDQQIEWCAGKENPTPDLQISSCTVSIQSGRLSGKGLSVIYSQRGNAYFIKGQYDPAIQDYDQAIRLNPQDVFTFTNRGNAYFIKGQYNRAIQDYDQAIRLDPQYANAFYLRGLAKQKKGDNVGGDADIAKARQLQPWIGQ